MSRRWTTAELTTLGEKYRSGCSLGDIAASMGRSKNSVRMALHYYRMYRKRSDLWSENDDRVVRSYLSLEEIARVIGRTPGAVATRRSRLGVSRRRQKVGKTEISRD